MTYLLSGSCTVLGCCRIIFWWQIIIRILAYVLQRTFFIVIIVPVLQTAYSELFIAKKAIFARIKTGREMFDYEPLKRLISPDRAVPSGCELIAGKTGNISGRFPVSVLFKH